MATITVKDIPDELYEAFKKKAAANHRSVNREMIYLIEQAVGQREIDVEQILAEARRLHATIGPLLIDEEILHQARNSGRP